MLKVTTGGRKLGHRSPTGGLNKSRACQKLSNFDSHDSTQSCYGNVNISGQCLI